MQLQGAYLRGHFLKLIFHMVLFIFKCTCFRATFKLIIVRRCITNEPVYQMVNLIVITLIHLTHH